MKRDMDLIRTILLEIEQTTFTGKGVGLAMPDCDPVALQYHLVLLTEAGLIQSINSPNMRSNVNVSPIRLTWEGHEFLDAARNDNIWRKTMNLIGSRGLGLTFELVKAVLIQEARQLPGMPFLNP